MKPQEYIERKLEGLKTTSDIAPPENLAEYIYRCVMSKKFRKYSVNPEYTDHIRSAIELNIKNNEPIKFSLVFGGYKLWRLEESPEVDWAELFSLIYYTNWVKPIAAAYAPGVWFDFFSDDVIIERMNGIPKSETELYNQSFHALLKFVGHYLPKNIQITLNRVGDQYESYDAFLKDLDNQIATLRERGLSPLTEEQITTIHLNVKEKPTTENWEEEVQLTHDGYAQAQKRRPYYRTPDKLMVSTRPISNALAVGTTKSSVVKFWIGGGALQKTGDGFKDVILSPNQIESFDGVWQILQIPGLEGKNFSKIRIKN